MSLSRNDAQATAAFKYHYGEMLDAGVQIYEYPGAVVHAKLMVADDSVLFGTVNIDAWALYRNYEVAMLARDPETVARFEERIFTPDIAKSRLAQPAHGLGARLQHWFWDRLAYFL
jgi:cardiolipin synthase